jgi:hypothetical protein
MRNNKLRYIYITIASGLLLLGCVNTEGTLEIKGKVIDEFTKVQIPGREIIIQGLIKSNNKFVTINAGQFSTDSLGYFIFSFEKIKDVRYYIFNIVGDSNYAFTKKTLGLFELEQNAKYLSFSLNKLVNLTIIINKTSKIPLRDTLYLSWESNRIDFRMLYPYKIENYGITDNSFVSLPGIGLRWIGGDINSTIKTRVFAEKMTKIHWELVRNKDRKEFIDTITCKRDMAHIINFTY